MPTVTTALIGCGVRGVTAHGPWTKDSQKFELLAVCDVDESRRSYAAAKLGVPAVDDYRELLQRPELQSVIIATTAPWHAPIGLAAMRAGKHVLIEKPLADSAEAARQLAAEAQRQGVVGMVAYPRRFSAFGQMLKRLLADVDPLQALFTAQRAPLNPQFFQPDHYAGIVDDTSHTLDLALWLMGGRPTSVYAQIGRGAITGDRTIDRIDVIIEIDGGIRTVNIHASMLGIEAENLVQVIGKLGVVSSRDRRHIRASRHPLITEAGRVSRREVYERRQRQDPGRQDLGPLTALNSGRPIDITVEEIDAQGAADQEHVMDDYFADLITGAVSQSVAATLADGAKVIAVTEAMVRAEMTGSKVAL